MTSPYAFFWLLSHKFIYYNDDCMTNIFFMTLSLKTLKKYFYSMSSSESSKLLAIVLINQCFNVSMFNQNVFKDKIESKK